jgi:hypothetical protein
MDVARRRPVEVHRRMPDLHIRIVVLGDRIFFERDDAAPVGPAGCHGFVDGLRAVRPAVLIAHTVANCADRFLDQVPPLSSWP